MAYAFQLFGRVWRNIYEHKYTYIVNVALLQLFLMTIGSFLLSTVFKLVLLVSNQSNINQTNITQVLKNPFSLLLIVGLIIVLALLLFIEYSLITMLIYSKIRDTHFSLRSIGKNALSKVKMIIGIHLLFFVGYFILMIPLANLGISSALLEEIYIPKFITGEIMKTTQGTLLYGAVLVLLFYINLRLIFVLPLTITNNNSFYANIKQSWQLTKIKQGSWYLTILLLEAVISILMFVFVIGFTVILYLIDSTGDNLIVQTIFYTVLSGVIFFFTVLAKISAITTLVMVISDKKIISHELYTHEKEEKRQSKFLALLIGVTLLASLLYNGYKINGAALKENISLVGHRGYVAEGVENTVESLEGAARQGSDYAEIDIILTKDNKFVVMHDNNLKRLAGINKNVRELNFDEVVGLEVKQGTNTGKIPDLDTLVKRAQELGIKLLVELKPYGGEPENYAELVIAKLKELGVAYDYKVMSLNLDVMERINTLEPKIDTGYVIPMLFGSFANDNVDFFVIEDFSYNIRLAEQARIQEKKVFVWTINDEKRIEDYLQKPIDGIITDVPNVVTKKEKELKENNSYYDRLLRLIK